MRWVVGVIACAAGVARADRYPETYVDRPLVMYAGMTALDISEDGERYTTNGIRYDNQLDLDVTHSFGPVEVSLRTVGITADIGAGILLGCDDSIGGGFTDYVPQTYLKYGYGEFFNYVHKARVVPHVLALYERVSMNVTQESLTPAMARASAGTIVATSIATSAQVQLTPRLSVDLGGSASFPVAHSSSLLVDPRASGDAYVELVQTLHAWDLYAHLGVGDLTETHYLYGAAGFVHRWGG
ncbi:MAG: hypothetical protein ACM31C_25100 [Acidobacteriota bacterium]